MPRWKALPDELDPQVREFASQLRRLVDRSGLSVAAVAERTGYSRTSWERYLGGRLLAPKAAVLALAEVTGTSPVHLTTMWELAERAWSRSEQRHERTMEAARADRARSAPGAFGPAPPEGSRALPVDAGPTGRRPPRVPEPPGGRHRRRIVMFLAGVIGALLVITSAVLLTDLGRSDDKPRAKPSPSRSASASAPALPAGVKCVAASCTGQDPELMGCTDKLVQTVGSAKVGASVVEVRYSRTCGAAWARLKQVAPGDRVEIGAPGAAGYRVVADAYRDTYTKMLAVQGPAGVRACATLTSGRSGCAEGRAAAGPSGAATGGRPGGSGTTTTGQ
ncbi:helix-turn-helix domain-containing protein [Streptomyces sp. NPDC006691]|uniref:helix-turn-helix domain-containing protein n=1 Tax=Streptomyces sp. NPDC006691 TaxID=3364757 RepID=UPI0036D0BE6C